MTSTQSAPAQISRFRILSPLGEGAQGIVYQAYDTQLERNVAIKTLRLASGAAPDQATRLLEGARTASRLSHPNVVPVFEVGMHDGQPYVVFEYVDGRNLSDMLTTDGALAPERAVAMMSAILSGIAHVHANGLLHGDIKPENILVAKDGVPRVTDFGIARTARRAAGEKICSGTAPYMAPECLISGHSDYRSDVFALGLLFHEMLTGRAVFGGENDYARLYRMMNETVTAPSRSVPGIDRRIDEIVLRATDRSPEARYANAAEMKTDLDRLHGAQPGLTAPTLDRPAPASTISFLLRRMSLKSDFPALSATFSRINELTARADESSMQAISDLVIRDFALTQKLLKVVNSAEFAVGKITRVSQAITLLGMARLRSLAIGLMLASGHRRGPNCPAVAATLTDFFVAGVIARNVGRMTGLKSAEELFICGMFSRLGQMLTLYYLREEHDAIQRHAADHGTDTMTSSKAILGMDYDELGISVARHWNFPEVIVTSMHSLPAGVVLPPAGDEHERIRHCAVYARELCALARIEEASARESAFCSHQARFARSVQVDPAQLRALLAHSMDAATKYVAAAELDISQTTLIDGLKALSSAANDPDSPPSDPAAGRSASSGRVAPTEAGARVPQRHAPVGMSQSSSALLANA